MKNVSETLLALTIEEKAALLEGVHSWSTNEVPRVGIPSLFLTDGPHGLRKVRKADGGFGVTNNENSTAFPTSATVASSWNLNNAYHMGEAIARECIDAEVDVLLAPGVNIKRSPLCGRNFEYYSEDPLVSGSFGEAFVQGVQSMGIGCCVKHFAVNSNEKYRFIGDSIVDERALHEIYLRAFERIVKNSKPYSVMCSYNQVNGIFASQNKTLLTDILRDEWGFNGIVMTDWGATCNRVEGVLAGCDLDMPGGVWYNRKIIIDAVKTGKLPLKVLDRAVMRILELNEKCNRQKPASPYHKEDHEKLSCEIAKDSAVLLKNDGVLPLTGNEKLLIVGEMFEKMRYQGAGSSLINPPRVVTPKDAFDKRGISYTYEKGYRCFYSARDTTLERSAIEAAKMVDTIVFFGGLTDFEESEGFDREHLRMGENQTRLLHALLATGKKVVLVLYAGSPVELPFLEGLSALLDMYLPGMYGGEATAALLYGESVPCGKLAESWPMRAEDSSCYADYNRSSISRYYESIYVGYRFYDKVGTTLCFPFGYGLSYTCFQYSNLTVSESGLIITVKADITNTGKRDGSEIVQLYVRNGKSNVFKAEKELRAFTKVFLQAGETKAVTMTFQKSDLAYWNVKQHRWILENGIYEICVAASAIDILLTVPFHIKDGVNAESPYSGYVEASYTHPPHDVPGSFTELADDTPIGMLPRKPFTLESTLADLKGTLMGRVLYLSVMRVIQKEYKNAVKMPDSLERDMQLKNSYFLVRMMPFNSIRSMCMSSGGRFDYNTAVGFVELANGQLIRGIRTILKKKQHFPYLGEENRP